MSDVQRDMNAFGEYLIERVFKKTGSTNATATDTTNYVNYDVTGKIIDVIRFKYDDSTYQDQYYSFTSNRIVLKKPVTAASDFQMDILYLRDTTDVDSTDDYIDMPNQLIPIFEMLCRHKIITDLDPKADLDNYNIALNRMQNEILKHAPDNSRLYRETTAGVSGYYMGLTGGNDIYDITHKFIGIDNFTADGNGDYLHNDE
jgi:hypothetical protein